MPRSYDYSFARNGKTSPHCIMAVRNADRTGQLSPQEQIRGRLAPAQAGLRSQLT